MRSTAIWTSRIPRTSFTWARLSPSFPITCVRASTCTTKFSLSARARLRAHGRLPAAEKCASSRLSRPLFTCRIRPSISTGLKNGGLTMATLPKTVEPDESKLNAFMEKAVADMGAARHATLVVLGDKLGLYKAMAGAGWMTPAELAAQTGTAERYVREWLDANAASGYVSYNAETQQYQLPPEQEFALTVLDLPGAFHVISACFKDEPKITQAFRTGEGVGWHEHDANLFFGTERFFRPNYANNLISSWIPALDGVSAKLASGGTVADVGCGHGASTMLM